MELSDTENQRKILEELAFAKMPFGKYSGKFLSELPEAYVIWFRQKGFPSGKLGTQLEQIYEIKLNGLEELLRNIRRLKNVGK
ncbi:MAG: DUF3820 family protein [Bacteroidales bacterium]|nr:DUF3820 family protein [Bacteroidales bacterium]MBN2756129.1 DUF3820 family protein [Bacteroidales bacterium]